MKTVRDVLVEARELILDQSRWTREANARSSDGSRVPPWSASACKFCGNGALLHAIGFEGVDSMVYSKSVDELRSASLDIFPNHSNFTRVNDALGHEAIIEVFDLAIERAG